MKAETLMKMLVRHPDAIMVVTYGLDRTVVLLKSEDVSLAEYYGGDVDNERPINSKFVRKSGTCKAIVLTLNAD